MTKPQLSTDSDVVRVSDDFEGRDFLSSEGRNSKSENHETFMTGSQSCSSVTTSTRDSIPPPLDQHVSHEEDEGRVDAAPPELRGDGTRQVDQDRDSGQDSRDQGSSWRGGPGQEAGSHTPAASRRPIQQGTQEQECPDQASYRGLRHHADGERDDEPTRECGDADCQRLSCRLRPGHGRVRTLQRYDLCGAPFRGAQLCGLGGHNRQGGRQLRSSSTASGRMAPEGDRDQEADAEDQDGRLPPEGARDHGHLGREQFPDYYIQEEGQEPGCGSHSGAHPDSPRTARGSGQPSGGTTPEEGPRERREDQLSANRLLSNALSSTTEASEPRTLGMHNRQMSEAQARDLEHQAWALVPELFQDLTRQDRVVLMEVACEPDSRLSAAVQQKMGNPGAAVRAALWNHCDLGTGSGVKLILERIRL